MRRRPPRSTGTDPLFPCTTCVRTLGGCGEPGEESEEDGDAPHREATQRLDDLLVPVQLRAQPRIDGTQAVGELDHAPHRDGHREEADDERSEEHTPELQSLMRRTYADCCWQKYRK